MVQPDKMDESGSAELDGIHPVIVQPLAEVLANRFTQLSNASLDGGPGPADWFTLTVIPVNKGGDRDDCITATDR